MRTTLATLALGLLFVFNLSAQNADTDSTQSSSKKIEKIANFDKIEITTVGRIVFEQSDKCTVHITGPKRLMNLVKYSVKNGELNINFGVKGININKNNKNDQLEIFVTAPTLKSVDLLGVGDFVCKKTLNFTDFSIKLEGVGRIDIDDLNCDNLEVDIAGVGKADIHVNCRNTIKGDVDGVGSLTLSGTTKYLDLDRSGVSRIQTRKLTVTSDK